MSNQMQGRRRRVLLVIAGLGAGGAERQMALLARELDRTHNDVGLLIFNAKERVHYQDVFERPLWFRALGLSRKRCGPLGLAMAMIIGIRRAVTEFKPDVIHTSLHVANVAVRSASVLFFPRIPVVTSIRCNFLLLYPRFDQVTEKLLSRYSAAIIANSEATRQQLLGSLPIPAQRVVTVENGIDPRFSPGPANTPVGWPTNGRVALTVGRLAPEKNHLAMIKVLKVLDAQGRLGDWNFVIVGEGALRSQIIAATQNFPRIHLLPPTTDLLPYYRNADVLLLPSLHEGMSNVALEAQACGLPVALTVGANTSGVVSNQCGWIVEGDMITALARVLVVQPNEMRSMGKLAEMDVLNRFGADNMAKNTEKVYRLAVEKI